MEIKVGKIELGGNFLSCRKVARVCFVMLHVANVFEFMTIWNQIKNILSADDSSDGLLRHFSWATFSIILIVLTLLLYKTVSRWHNLLSTFLEFLLINKFVWSFQNFLSMSSKLKHDNFSPNVINMGEHQRLDNQLSFKTNSVASAR